MSLECLCVWVGCVWLGMCATQKITYFRMSQRRLLDVTKILLFGFIFVVVRIKTICEQIKILVVFCQDTQASKHC